MVMVLRERGDVEPGRTHGMNGTGLITTCVPM